MSPTTEAAVTEIAPFEAAHLDEAVALSRAENWPHRREDWALGLGLSRGVVALAGGRVVGTALATPFGRTATLSSIIVAARMRGQGLGRVLVERAMALLKAEEWRLVATRDGLPLYRKLGFVEGVVIHQHQGVVSGAGRGEGVRWAPGADLRVISRMDLAATGADRAGLIAAMVGEGRVAVLGESARPEGFAILRPFGRGFVAGPVVARDAGEARRLLSFVITECAGQFLRIDVPEDSGLSDWLADVGLAHVGGGLSMTRGQSLPLHGPLRRFALAAQAFG